MFGVVVEQVRNRWRSLVTIFGRRKARSAEAQLRLTQSYRRVFRGSPSPEDQQIVLADLACHSGFSRVSSYAVSASELRHREGMRELFSHIHRHLNLAPEDVASLENAARLEAVAEGNI